MINHAIYSEEAGAFISSKHQRLAEILQDVDEYLELRWIPPQMRTDVDISRPYCIVHSLPGKPPYVVMYFDESTEPEQILSQIIAGDNWGKMNVLQKLEMQEKAIEVFNAKQRMEEGQESADMAHFLMTNRSNNYVRWKDRSTGEMVKLDSQRRRVEP